MTPVSYGSGNLSGNLNFDNRALQNPTLENLRKYAREGSFKYNTPHGLVAKSDVPFEVLGYEGGRLHIRIQEEVHSMTKQVPAQTCTALTPECTVFCFYADSSHSGGSGEPVQFKADVFAPLVITPALN